MGPYVHKTLTEKWARSAGFSAKDARVIGQANIGLDDRGLTKPWLHFPLFGSLIIARFLFFLAIRKEDLALLGYSLHCVQDSVSHGYTLFFFHKPVMDDWGQLSPASRERLKSKSADLLKSFQNKR